MSNALLRYKQGKTTTFPSLDSNEYTDDSNDDKSFSSQIGNVRNLFLRARVGDLVIVPGSGHYEPFLIGEFSSSFAEKQTFSFNNTKEDEIPFREVRWLRTDLTKHSLPSELSKKIYNRHAIVQNRRNDTLDQIYNFAYQSVIYGNSSKIDITGHSYQGKRPNELVDASLLISFLANAHTLIKDGKLEEIINRGYYSIAHELDIEIGDSRFSENFNSPGQYTLISLLASLPLFISAGIHVFDAVDFSKFSQLTVEFVNSEGPTDHPAVKSAQENIDLLIQSLDQSSENAKSDIKKSFERAKQRVDLKAPGSTEIDPSE